MNLDDNSKIPVTDYQVNSFYAWVKHTYGTYDIYKQVCNEGPTAITEYFMLNILSPEMTNAYDESDPYVGLISDDPYINKLQLYRRRIAVKISRTNRDLISRAFPAEFAEYNYDESEDQKLTFKFWHHLNTLYHEHFVETSQPYDPPTFVHHQLCKEAVDLSMTHECSICLTKHKMLDACITNCGHQFGTKCMINWSHNTCPECSDYYKEITIFIA
jgi:hypothetical protein